MFYFLLEYLLGAYYVAYIIKVFHLLHVTLLCHPLNEACGWPYLSVIWHYS